MMLSMVRGSVTDHHPFVRPAQRERERGGGWGGGGGGGGGGVGGELSKSRNSHQAEIKLQL